MKKINDLTALEAISLYQELQLNDEAENITNSNTGKDLDNQAWPWNRKPRAWEHSSYTYGFIPGKRTSKDVLSITEARTIRADETLRNSRVTISLDFIRIFDFPGKGLHRILFRFNAINFLEKQEQPVSFNHTFPVMEGQRGPISGYPVFIGLRTGTELLQFSTELINVSNDQDDRFLQRMESGIVKNGMKLIETLNPVIPVMNEYATGIMEMIGNRNRNVSIVSPEFGLYFDKNPSRLKLAEGSYIAVQTSEPEKFKWEEWKFDKGSGAFINQDGTMKDLPFNYFVFSISRTTGDSSPN